MEHLQHFSVASAEFRLLFWLFSLQGISKLVFGLTYAKETVGRVCLLLKYILSMLLILPHTVSRWHRTTLASDLGILLPVSLKLITHNDCSTCLSIACVIVAPLGSALPVPGLTFCSFYLPPIRYGTFVNVLAVSALDYS